MKTAALCASTCAEALQAVSSVELDRASAGAVLALNVW